MGWNHNRDEEPNRRGFFDNLYDRQVQQSEQLTPLLSLYIKDTVQKEESRYYTRLKNMMVRYLEQKIVGNISLLVKDNLKNPSLAMLQPRASRRAKDKETVDIAYNGQQEVSAAEKLNVGMKTRS